MRLVLVTTSTFRKVCAFCLFRARFPILKAKREKTFFFFKQLGSFCILMIIRDVKRFAELSENARFGEVASIALNIRNIGNPKNARKERNAMKNGFRNDSDGGLSSLAVGYAWVARISTFSFEFAALVGLGYFLDRRFGVEPWGTIVGAGIGLFAFVSGLLATVKRLDDENCRAETPKKSELLENPTESTKGAAKK